MKSPITQPIETLRLNDREKTKLLWAIEQVNRQDIDEELRQLRVACTNTEATLTLIKDGGEVAQLAVLVRNLSRGGPRWCTGVMSTRRRGAN